ncbi:ATP-binding protein [Ectobacillus sp. sgz5001026]|uniref:ATP-binding protein n=1 Tax=Ectobacillus sp. sgz5001026 TaxID=3242473 RepID=UPI0036D2F191
MIVIDELGYVPFTKMGSELLLQFFSGRYERASVVITTNLEFTEWTSIFEEEKMTGSLLKDHSGSNSMLTNTPV